jgi:hypothetical protein
VETHLAGGGFRHGPVNPTTRPYHSRPFQVLRAERFTTALRARITDPALGSLPDTGAIDQWVDSTDALSDVRNRKKPGPETI